MMDPGGGDHSAHSPGRSSYDPATLIGASALDAVGLPAFGGLSHLPSAFSMLGRLPMFPSPVPFGGLGGIPDPLRPPPGSLGHALSPTTGMNGSVSDPSSMFQLPSFSTTTTTTTTTSASCSSPASAGSYKSPSSDKDGRHGEKKAVSEKKNKNPLSVESLTKAENAVMSPFFFPFGTVSTTMPTMPSPYASHLLPGSDVSSLFPPPPGLGLFAPPTLSMATTSSSSSSSSSLDTASSYPYLSLPKVTATSSTSSSSPLAKKKKVPTATLR